jgi:hypothetical protein
MCPASQGHSLIQVDKCDDRGGHVNLCVKVIVAQQVPQQALQAGSPVQYIERFTGDASQTIEYAFHHQYCA